MKSAAAADMRKTKVCFTGFSDARKVKRVGNIRNFYRLNLKDIVSSKEVKEWFDDGIRQRLTAGGYITEKGEDDSCISLNGRILNVYTTSINKPGVHKYVAEVSAEIVVAFSGIELLRKEIREYIEKPSIRGSSETTQFDAVLSEALETFLHQMMHDVNWCESNRTSLFYKKSTEPIRNKKDPVVDDGTDAGSNKKRPMVCEVIFPDNDHTVKIINGERSEREILATLSPLRHRIQERLVDRSYMNPSLVGVVSVEMSISTTGIVSGLKLVKSTLNDTKIEEALLKKIKRTRFRKLEQKTAPTVAVYSLKFNPDFVQKNKKGVSWLLAGCSGFIFLITILFLDTT